MNKGTWKPGDEMTAEKLRETGVGFTPAEQDTPGLTLQVSAGVSSVNGSIVKFDGDDSPSFTAPAANPRIDLLCLEDDGSLSRTAGAENASPVAPAYPSDKLVIAEIYNRVGQTSVKNEDDSSNGYILRIAKWVATGSSSPTKQVYTSADTWTKPAGLKYVIVEVQAGGGGGGGVTFTDNWAAGGGGGGYAKKLILATDLGGTESITVGAAGTAGLGSGGDGGNGGGSSFGSHITCGGGGGGQGGGGANSGGTAGTATGGDINVPGQVGEKGWGISSVPYFGDGGDSVLGFGGKMGNSGTGNAGTGYGAGGGGANNNNSDSVGGAGLPGIVIVWEFY